MDLRRGRRIGLVGYERKIIGGLSWFLENGYVFNGELLYDTVPSDIEIDDTSMVRIEVRYLEDSLN